MSGETSPPAAATPVRAAAAALLVTLCLLGGGAGAQEPSSENTLRLGEAGTPPAARIADLAWLAGYWVGEGLGGTVEELWTPPVGDRMQGIFTLAREGQPVFSEAMQLVEEEGSLVLRVRHFTPEFVAWEEKDDFVRFRLVRLADDAAYFSGLTLRRDGDRLWIYIVLQQGGERQEHELRLKRAALEAGGAPSQ